MIPLTTFISSCPLPCNRVGPLHSRVGVTSIPVNKKRKQLSTKKRASQFTILLYSQYAWYLSHCRPTQFRHLCETMQYYLQFLCKTISCHVANFNIFQGKRVAARQILFLQILRV